MLISTNIPCYSMHCFITSPHSIPGNESQSYFEPLTSLNHHHPDFNPKLGLLWYLFKLCYNNAFRHGLCYSHAAPFMLDSLRFEEVCVYAEGIFDMQLGCILEPSWLR